MPVAPVFPAPVAPVAPKPDNPVAPCDPLSETITRPDPFGTAVEIVKIVPEIV